MSLIDRVFKRKLKPSLSVELVRQSPGPVTAHEAWVMANPAPDAPDVDSAPLYLQKRITPIGARADRALPVQFRDSPEVVAAFTAAGVDFISGATDMKPETGFSADGIPVWVTYCWGRKVETYFAQAADGLLR